MFQIVKWHRYQYRLQYDNYKGKFRILQKIIIDY